MLAIKKDILKISLAISLGIIFTFTVSIFTNTGIEANSIAAEQNQEDWLKRINQGKSEISITQSQTPLIIGKLKNKYNVYLEMVNGNYQIYTNKKNFAEASSLFSCYTTVKYGLIFIGMALILAAASTGVAMGIGAITLSAAWVQGAAGMIIAGAELSKSASQIATGFCNNEEPPKSQ